MLDLEEFSYCDLDAVIAVDEVVVDEEHLLFLWILARQLYFDS